MKLFRWRRKPRPPRDDAEVTLAGIARGDWCDCPNGPTPHAWTYGTCPLEPEAEQ